MNVKHKILVLTEQKFFRSFQSGAIHEFVIIMRWRNKLKSLLQGISVFVNQQEERDTNDSRIVVLIFANFNTPDLYSILSVSIVVRDFESNL